MRKFATGLPSPAMAVAATALFIALGGTGYAASTLIHTHRAVAAKKSKHADAKADKALVKSLAPTLSVGFAKAAGSASKAASATTAGHASSADSATNAGHASTADSATSAGHASTADSATNANHASSAETAGHATSADTATSAATAASATTATSATHAAGADNVGGLTPARFSLKGAASSAPQTMLDMDGLKLTLSCNGSGNPVVTASNDGTATAEFEFVRVNDGSAVHESGSTDFVPGVTVDLLSIETTGHVSFTFYRIDGRSVSGQFAFDNNPSFGSFTGCSAGGIAFGG